MNRRDLLKSLGFTIAVASGLQAERSSAESELKHLPASILPGKITYIRDDRWLDGFQWVKANGVNGHTSTIRLFLPINVTYTKPKLFNLFHPLVEVSQRDLFQQFFYGRGGFDQIVPSDPPEISGLSMLYNTRDPQRAQNAVNVIDAGGREGPLTSAWIIASFPGSVFGITPNGDRPIRNSRVGLAAVDWRYAARVANIATDVNTAGVAGLKALLARALLRLPTLGKKAVIYLNDDLRKRLGADVYRGLPVRVVPLCWDETLVV